MTQMYHMVHSCASLCLNHERFVPPPGYESMKVDCPQRVTKWPQIRDRASGESLSLLCTRGAVDRLYSWVIASRPRSTTINTRTLIFTKRSPRRLLPPVGGGGGRGGLHLRRGP
jgi:hypothetical protein